jgi:hypothetical protein
MINKSKWLLLALVIVGFVIRFWQVDALPAILNRDEAALAYNALLLKEVGQDEWQRSWPLALESFGDYKLPGYVFTLVGFFHLFGYQDWVVRLPATLAGTWLIIISFGLAKKFNFSNRDATWLATLITFSPIFFFYSRIAFEALLGLSLFLTYLWLVLPSKLSQKKAATDIGLFKSVAAVLVLLFAVFTYNTPFLLLPFLVVLIPMLFGLKNWKSWWLVVIGSLLVFFTTAMVLMPLTSQKSTITIFSNELLWRNSVIYRENFPKELQPVLGSKYIYFAGVSIQNLFNSFGPNFLVKNGGSHPWHSLPKFGHMVWTIYLAGLFGFLATICNTGLSFWSIILSEKKSLPNKLKTFFDKTKSELLLIYLLLIGLLPSIVTVDAPHTTRSLLFLYMWQFFAVIGVSKLSTLATSSIFKRKFNSAHLVSLIKILVLVFALETSSYFWNYFTVFANQHPSGLGVGYEKVITEVEKTFPNREIAVIDGGGYQYIITAWYLRTSPTEYFTSNVRQLPNQLGFRYGQQVTHYHFIANIADKSDQEQIVIEQAGDKWQVLEF